MDLYVNARYSKRRTTGVERYAAETVRALGDRCRLIAPRGAAVGLRGHIWEQIILPRRVPAGGVLWSPANTGPLRVRHQVVTVHDLAPLDHPEWFRPSFAVWYRWLLPRLLRRVRAVVAVSEFTRSRLLALGVREAELFVARPGVSPRFHPIPEDERSAARRRLGLPDRYVLSVGTVEPRKNLSRLWQAWASISGSHPDVGLVCLGAEGSSFRPVDRAEAPRGVRFLGDLPDEDLLLSYAAAEVYVLPSLYEGFGLTALEAMASGVPCIVSRAGGIPEAVGDAAILFDPMDVGALGRALDRLLEERSAQGSWSVRGLERARAFRWEATAESIWAACSSIGD
jgi:glycosyltransferase involved in cell wall biosynthesis